MKYSKILSNWKEIRSTVFFWFFLMKRNWTTIWDFFSSRKISRQDRAPEEVKGKLRGGITAKKPWFRRLVFMSLFCNCFEITFFWSCGCRPRDFLLRRIDNRKKVSIANRCPLRYVSILGLLENSGTLNVVWQVIFDVFFVGYTFGYP